MEDLHASGRVGALGASNVTLAQLEELCAEASVRPAFVQNRCHASTGWDRRVRASCAAEGIVYQGFSLLTANRAEIATPEIARIAARTGLTREQVVFRFALDAGMLPLTGTTSPEHMREDLAAAASPPLREDDVRAIERIAS